MHVLYQGNSIFPQGFCRSRSIVGFKVEVEVAPLVHELDRGVPLVARLRVSGERAGHLLECLRKSPGTVSTKYWVAAHLKFYSSYSQLPTR